MEKDGNTLDPVNTAKFMAPYAASGLFTFDSSSYGTFAAGAGLTSTNGVLDVGAGTGITVNANDVQLKNAGSLTTNSLTKWDGTQLVNSVVSDNGTTVASTLPLTVTGGIFATGNITGSNISGSGAVSGLTLSSATTVIAGSNISAASGYIKAGSPVGAPDTPGAVEGLLGYFTSATVGTLGVSGNATITGDLTVAGTASFNNTTSLLIADKFVY